MLILIKIKDKAMSDKDSAEKLKQKRDNIHEHNESLKFDSLVSFDESSFTNAFRANKFEDLSRAICFRVSFKPITSAFELRAE
jgi:hypothetical protein